MCGAQASEPPAAVPEPSHAQVDSQTSTPHLAKAAPPGTASAASCDAEDTAHAPPHKQRLPAALAQYGDWQQLAKGRPAIPCQEAGEADELEDLVRIVTEAARHQQGNVVWMS